MFGIVGGSVGFAGGALGFGGGPFVGVRGAFGLVLRLPLRFALGPFSGGLKIGDRAAAVVLAVHAQLTASARRFGVERAEILEYRAHARLGGGAFQLPCAGVLTGTQQLRYALCGVVPRRKLAVPCVPCGFAAGYAEPVAVNPRGIFFSVNFNANATAINRGQKRGNLVERALFLKLGSHALTQVTRVFANAEYGVNDLL